MRVQPLHNTRPDIYINAIKRSVIKPIFRLALLYYDETIKEDITDYIIADSGSLSINYNQGQRRSFDISLNNEDGKFIPMVNSNIMWIDQKVQLDIGIEVDGVEIYNTMGIFVVSNPDVTRMGKTITIHCLDKFSMLDGTLGGVIGRQFKIEKGRNVRSEIMAILNLDRGNSEKIDLKPLSFDDKYKDTTTSFEIVKEANDSFGSIIVELANMIACDVYYNTNGSLTISDGNKDINYKHLPSVWDYKDYEAEYISSGIQYDYQKVKNKAVVTSGNSNDTTIYSYTATNTNPLSPTRISLIGERIEYISDSNITTTDMAKERAQYTLNKLSILQNSISLQSTYMIHLDVNQCITLTDEYYKYIDNKFIIQSLTIPLSIGSQISIQCTNIATLPYYEK